MSGISAMNTGGRRVWLDLGRVCCDLGFVDRAKATGCMTAK